jgi:hypothetical protein
MIIPPPGNKVTGRETDYSLPLIKEVQNQWRCTSIPPYAFHVVYRNDFTFHRLKEFKDKVLGVFENKRQEI